ncbi:unnamed protein product [Didymodactylos carnosus]|uniref:Major facilitator superfamily (MFS) profile domain-containing protein n=1 Tax=Didymodactylos carnosus TaxID=1234261 RepID=A0A814IR23_9BILA|nr:unnamed protein product [Didymodactylos carnosus]CAF3797912.1 unnamed protein product [Didymodactylos carnosus]
MVFHRCHNFLTFLIFYFGDVILSRTNLPYEFTPYACLSFGITYLAVAITLVFILDKVGRRSLFSYGLVGMGTAAMVIGVTILKSRTIRLYHMIFLNIFAIMGHTGFFALGPGAIPWLVTSEMFFQSERAYASSFAIIANWLTHFVVVQSFIPLFNAIDSILFLIYGGICLGVFLLTYLFLPETRRKTPGEVQVLVGKGTVYKTKHQQ